MGLLVFVCMSCEEQIHAAFAGLFFGGLEISIFVFSMMSFLLAFKYGCWESSIHRNMRNLRDQMTAPVNTKISAKIIIFSQFAVTVLSFVCTFTFGAIREITGNVTPVGALFEWLATLLMLLAIALFIPRMDKDLTLSALLRKDEFETLIGQYQAEAIESQSFPDPRRPLLEPQ